MLMNLLFQKNANLAILRRALSSYTQGHSFTDEANTDHRTIREYFYHLDHEGQLFLDDTKIKNFTSCYKEQRFLDIFFRNLRMNETGNYQKDFPFMTNCGSERNFLRCDDLPFVVTNLDKNTGLAQLNHLQSINWSIYFDPNNLFHHQISNRLYYLFENKQVLLDVPQKDEVHSQAIDSIRKKYAKIPCKVGLVKSSLAIDLLKTLKPLDEKSDLEALKAGNKYKLDYKAKTYVLNSRDDHPIYNMIKKFSMYKEHHPEHHPEPLEKIEHRN